MYCFRCGTKVEENTKFCPHCGADILQEQQNYNYTTNNTHEDQYKYSENYSNTEESLIEAYIGPNYNKFKSNRFSLPSFFLGGYYFIYRKMYLYGILVLILNLSILLMPALAGAMFFINIAIACFFYTIYRSFVIKNITIIKEKKVNTTSTEIIAECTKKGGTNLGVPIALAFIIFATVFIGAFTYTFIKLNKEETVTISSPSILKIKDANYTVPEEFKKNNYITDTTKTYYQNNNECNFNLETTNDTTLYPSAKEFLKSSVYINENNITSEILTIPINNTNYNYVELKSSYTTRHIYTTMYKNLLYKIEFNIYNSKTSSCQNINTEVMNSISFN